LLTKLLGAQQHYLGSWTKRLLSE